MGTQPTENLTTLIRNLIRAYLKRLSDITRLAKLEARLAGKSFIRILFLLFILGFLFMSGWLCILLMLFLCFISLQFSFLSSALIITFINLLLMIGILLYVKHLKKALFFPVTRKQLNETKLPA